MIEKNAGWGQLVGEYTKKGFDAVGKAVGGTQTAAHLKDAVKSTFDDIKQTSAGEELIEGVKSIWGANKKRNARYDELIGQRAQARDAFEKGTEQYARHDNNLKKLQGSRDSLFGKAKNFYNEVDKVKGSAEAAVKDDRITGGINNLLHEVGGTLGVKGYSTAAQREAAKISAAAAERDAALAAKKAKFDSRKKKFGNAVVGVGVTGAIGGGVAFNSAIKNSTFDEYGGS